MTFGNMLFISGAVLLGLTVILAVIFIIKRPKYVPGSAAYEGLDGSGTQRLRSGYPTDRLTVRRDPIKQPAPGQAVLSEGTSLLTGAAAGSISTTEKLEGTAKLAVQETEPLEGTAKLAVQETEPLEGTAELAVQETEPLEGTAKLAVQETEALTEETQDMSSKTVPLPQGDAAEALDTKTELLAAGTVPLEGEHQ